MITIDGLVSGLDTGAIIDGLLALQQQRVDRLNVRKQDLLVRQASFKGVEARLASLRGAISRMARSVNNVLDAKSVRSSHADLAAATATSSAPTGAYQFTINSLATAHVVAAQGFDDEDAAVTQGELTVRVGSGPAATITVDDSNDTLRGLADAINNSQGEVTASIVNDGGASPYRLLLSAKKTGAANAISITNGLAASGGGAVRPEFTTSPAVQEPADAVVTIGSGAGAVTVQSATNRVEGLFPGLTIDLLTADPTKTVTLTVANDAESATKAVADFVQAFNDAMTYIDEQVKYQAESGIAGPLLGERSVTDVQDALRSAALDSVVGLGTQANRLSAVGITVNAQGRLDFNSTKFADALSGRTPGIAPGDVRRLFALDGQSSHAGVRFVLGGADTKESAAGYEVDIDQAATRAQLTAATALDASTLIDGTNNELTFTLDGKTVTVTLAEGTYTREELAAEVEAVAIAHPELVGRRLSAGLSGDALELTSDSYGSSSTISIVGGTALSALKFSGGETDNGQDVAGKFIVNGVVETATGSGRLLIGDSDNANTADLQVRILLGEADVLAGPEAIVTVSRGVAARLDALLNEWLDPVSGQVETVNGRFDDTIDGIDGSIARLNESFEAQRERLILQFAALESTLAQLQSTGNFLTAQLAALPAIGASRRS
jgi:flagellar hook-associated protein 2